MRDLIEQNQDVLVFAQGLAFFALGFAVWLQRRRASRLRLTSSLIWLAAFAFVEALAVWGDVFVPIQAETLGTGVGEGLLVLRAILQTVAFLFLLQFGLRLSSLSARARGALTALSLVVWVAVLAGVALAAGAQGWGPAEWEATVVAGCRYLILLPGALLSAVGLWRQRDELGAAGMTGIRPYAGAAAAALAVYALLGGVVVDDGPVAPPGLATAEGWFDVTGLPMYAMRGLAGLVLCVLAVKLLEIFDVEDTQRLEAVDRARAVAEERARFRRDLHDGTIQSIYAAGLHLESLAIRSTEAPVRREVREVVADLNAVTDGIRSYIRVLAQPPAGAAGIAAALGELTRRFAEETGRDARFRSHGAAGSGPLPDEAGQHLEQILREALSNTARHAGPCRVEVELAFAADELDLVVSDDGRGCDAVATPCPPTAAGGGQGLRNMRERARRLGGRLDVSASPSGGTRLSLAVPLDSELPEPEPAPAAAPAPTEVSAR